MKLSNLLTFNLIKVGLEGDNKEKVLEEMVDLFEKDGRISSKEEFYHKILEREAAGTTGMGRGVAIPHGKSEVVKELSFAMGISKKGVDFDSRDNRPVQIFFMIADFAGQSSGYLNLLSQISTLIRKEEFRKEILKVENKDEVIDIIKKYEQ
ncbi:PTS sugar transporter subunit IIA [Orenia marismortui]|uniref:Fructose-specific phosphotransferase system IIA component n=1 Tax=Orenia marismortui TaxID=46469 RepID=A0A4R8H0D2_9FIRM|nr:PTS sugar transporter subunit IIA [Orenia marismortui]TDX52741.1 fructose-specific phosphotransferase system IIA component [Orenia marismortui]